MLACISMAADRLMPATQLCNGLTLQRHEKTLRNAVEGYNLTILAVQARLDALEEGVDEDALAVGDDDDEFDADEELGLDGKGERAQLYRLSCMFLQPCTLLLQECSCHQPHTSTSQVLACASHCACSTPSSDATLWCTQWCQHSGPLLNTVWHGVQCAAKPRSEKAASMLLK